MYQLKQGIQSFTVVDGPFAGRTYAPGRTYAEIPPHEAGKFEKMIEPSSVRPAAKTAIPKALMVEALTESEVTK